MYRRPLPVLLLLGVTCVGTASRVAAQSRVDPPTTAVVASSVDSMSALLLAEFQVPGMAVGIVRHDSVLLARAYGVSIKGSTIPITSSTVFGIGSITKSMTGFLAARAVADGDLAWDAPIRARWPEFALPNDLATERVSIFDLLSHRTGIRRLDGLWQYAGLNADSLLTRLPWLPEVGDFPAEMRYSNINYAIAGGVLARTRHVPWSELLARDLFAPLGMTSSKALPSALRSSTGVAGRHTLVNDTLVYLPGQPTEIEAVAASGSVFSNLEDMLRYLRMLVGEGAFDGHVMLEHDAFARMLTPAGGDVRYPNSRRGMPLGYGAGWFLEMYDGEFLAWHSGVIEGYSAQMAFMPKRGLGVVVLSNRFGNPAPEVLSRFVLDQLTGSAVADYFGAYKSIVAQQRASARAEAAIAPYHDVVPGAPADYLGRYTHPAYGTVVIGLDGKANLSATYGGRHYRLGHRRAGLFVPVGEDPMDGEVGVLRFLFGPNQPPPALTWDLDDAGPIRFEREAPEASR